MASLRSSAPVLAGLLLVPGLGTCHHGRVHTDEPIAADTAEAAAALRGWHYEVTVDEAIERADVRVCFEGRPPRGLVPGAAAAAPHARDFRRADGEHDQAAQRSDALPRRDDAYVLVSLEDDACLEYAVDLTSLETDEDTQRMVGRTGRSMLTRPFAWLWRPDAPPVGADVTVRFALPESMGVSTPWPTRPHAPRTDLGGRSMRGHLQWSPAYVLDPTAFEWLSFVAIGEITVDRFERAGTEIELVTLDAPVACPPAGLRQWVEDAVDTVALLFGGRFPRERLQLVVTPVEGGGGGTVYFGMAARGGGAGVLIFLDEGALAEALPGGWTTVHELLHHGMPFIEEPWMAEGWVSYYTELVRTRAGHRSESEGWKALREAFERGRATDVGLSLARTSEQMHQTHAYQRVYWGGAAIAFFVDVEMRLETAGARGLDDAMQELRRCCGDAEHQWKARALLEHLDGWYGRPLFTSTAEAVLEANGFPDVEAALARLGVTVGIAGEIRLDDEHPAAEIRRAIMSPLR
jgi:hypothetical protein